MKQDPEVRTRHLEQGARGDELLVSGTALWIGLNDNVHIGELAEATAQRDGDGLKLAPYDGCAVTLRRAGPWLIVDDNMGCGGLNVTFRGVYRRT